MTTSGAAPGRPTARRRLADVAELAGVSAQTVSNVLNGRTGFSEATRSRVMAAVEQLRFQPDRAARHLRTRRSGQLGLHLPAAQLSPRNGFSISFLRAVIQAAEESGFQVVVFTQPIETAFADGGLDTAGVDAFVLFNLGGHDPRPAALAAAGVPFAAFGWLDPGVPQAGVDIDNVAAMRLVVDHLVGRGRRRFGYLGFAEPEHWNGERLIGTRMALADHGLALPDQHVLTGSFAELRTVLPPWLAAADRPEAVICASDALAQLVYDQMSRIGLRPGRELAVTGFDALPDSVELDPPLTSVALPVAEAAAAVVRLAMAQLDGRPAPTQGQILPTTLAVGRSS